MLPKVKCGRPTRRCFGELELGQPSVTRNRRPASVEEGIGAKRGRKKPLAIMESNVTWEIPPCDMLG